MQNVLRHRPSDGDDPVTTASRPPNSSAVTQPHHQSTSYRITSWRGSLDQKAWRTYIAIAGTGRGLVAVRGEYRAALCLILGASDDAELPSARP